MNDIGPGQTVQSMQPDINKNLLLLIQLLVYQGTSLPHDSVSCETKWASLVMTCFV